jgi:hypothetical protein
MSNQSLQPTRAIAVDFLNDYVNIPYPNEVMRGYNTSVAADTLIDTSGVDFVSQGIKVGDTVLNRATNAIANVTYVNPTELGLSFDIFSSNPESYIIYQGENTGCTLFVGGGGDDLTVLTADNNQVNLGETVSGSFIPIKVLRVYQTGTACSQIIALW